MSFEPVSFEPVSFEPASPGPAPVEPEALVRALHSIAAQDAPASRIDPDRARADGRRSLRNRRTAAGVGGTFAVALIAAVALSAGHVLGGGGIAAPATGVSTTPAVHTADWDPLVAPATFGWLPANAQNINYSVAPGPGQGPAVLGKGSEISDGQVGHDPAFIWLMALDPRAAAPKPGPLGDGSGKILIAAPDVNGRAAYWSVDPAKRNPDTGAAGSLYFQSPTGRWANVFGYYLGADPVASTLLHIANTAHVGDYPVPLPVQIGGLPADATRSVAEVNRPVPGAAWSVQLTFGVGKSGGMVAVSVDLADAKSVAEANIGDHCKVDNGLRICVQISGNVGSTLLPGGVAGFLHTVKSFGTNPAHWTTDVVVAKP